MEIKELISFSEEYVESLNALMCELAPEAVAVAASCRGRHIGRNLMERVIDDARRYGVQHMHLTSNPKRVAANGLYQSMGFQRKETNVYVMNLI